MSGKSKGLAAMVGRAKENTDAMRQTDAERSPTELLSLNNIVPSPFQARRDFSNLDELAEDIRRNGVLQPVLVRPLAGGQYELVAGERRWRASQQAGRERIPAVVRRMTEAEAREFGLMENLRREDLNAYEVARATVELASVKRDIPVAQVVADLKAPRPPEATLRAMDEALAVIGRKFTLRTFTRHYLPMLTLPDHLIAAIEGGAAYAAVGALRRATPEQQAEMLPRVTSGEWGVRDVEDALAAAQQASKPAVLITGGWESELRAVTAPGAAERLSALDGRKQRKAQRLLKELKELLGE